MELFETMLNEGHEQIVFCADKATGLKAIVAIHNTNLGAGTGGCRMYPYASEADALYDVLRLSKGMTYKAAITGLKMGGAKAVIIGNPKTQKNPALLTRFAKFVDQLNGRYVTAKDVGIDGNDLKIIKQETKHVLGIEGLANSSGDPSVFTAWGVYNGMKACAEVAYGNDSLKGKVVALQGLGSVSKYLVKHLADEGAKLIGTDVDAAACEKMKLEFGVEIVSPDKIYDVDCDIFSPTALGAIINSNTIPRLKCKIVAGGANNQLATAADGQALMQRGILYAPDYAINAGGLTNIYHELDGYNRERAWNHVAQIKNTIHEILTRSQKEKLPPHVIADQMAEERVNNARKS